MSKPHLIIEEGANKDQTIMVPETGARIGRAPENDIKLDDPSLSRFQCRLFFRDGALWLADLGSTNETLVNTATIQESMLRSGDLITIGETQIRVIRSRITEDEAEPHTGLIVSRPVPDSELDLGLEPSEPEPEEEARRHVPGFLWVVAAAAVVIALLAVGAMVLKQNAQGNPLEGIGTDGASASAADLPLQFAYEKVLGNQDNFYRLFLTLSGNKLMMEMHDVRDNRQVNDVKNIADEDLIKDLERKLNDTSFFASQPAYETSSTNRYEMMDLSISIGARTHQTRVLNQIGLPQEVEEAVELIYAFGEAEFGFEALGQPPEKLKELAERSWNMGLKTWGERTAHHSNLWLALKELERVEKLLKTIGDKPAFATDANELLKEGRQELEAKYEDYMFKVEQARQLADYEQAVNYLRIIIDLIPDRTQKRHQEAQTLLNQMEQRIPR